jgi:hypothetical protein
MLCLRVKKSIGVDDEAEVRGDGNDVVGEEVVMRHNGDDVMVKSRRRYTTETIRCDTWVRQIQLLLSRHDTRNSGPSGCIEVNFTLL